MPPSSTSAMESLNMNTLAKSLPNSNLATAERDLMNNFKAAAMSITTLYRSSLDTSKKAYNAGYAAACQDMLDVIQQGVSDRGAGSESDGGMNIGRVMDWVEARLEAMKSREEEEAEEEERDTKPKADAGPMKTSGPLNATSGRDKENLIEPTAQVTTVASQPTANSSQLRSHPTPSPPPVPRALPRSKQRAARDPAPESFTFVSPLDTNSSYPVSPALAEVLPVTPTVGSKRRHAIMSEVSSSPISTSPLGLPSIPPLQTNALNTNFNAGAGTSAANLLRRRKSGRMSAVAAFAASRPELQGSVPLLHQSEAMEVEDDGRERKRLARR